MRSPPLAAIHNLQLLHVGLVLVWFIVSCAPCASCFMHIATVAVGGGLVVVGGKCVCKLWNRRSAQNSTGQLEQGADLPMRARAARVVGVLAAGHAHVFRRRCACARTPHQQASTAMQHENGQVPVQACVRKLAYGGVPRHGKARSTRFCISRGPKQTPNRCDCCTPYAIVTLAEHSAHALPPQAGLVQGLRRLLPAQVLHVPEHG